MKTNKDKTVIEENKKSLPFLCNNLKNNKSKFVITHT